MNEENNGMKEGRKRFHTYMISSFQQRRQSCSLTQVYSIWHTFPEDSCCSAQMSSQWCNKSSSYKIKRFDICLNRSQCAGARKYNRLHRTVLPH